MRWRSVLNNLIKLLGAILVIFSCAGLLFQYYCTPFPLTYYRSIKGLPDPNAVPGSWKRVTAMPRERVEGQYQYIDFERQVTYEGYFYIYTIIERKTEAIAPDGRIDSPHQPWAGPRTAVIKLEGVVLAIAFAGACVLGLWILKRAKAASSPPANPQSLDDRITLTPRLYFSYSQFMVYDQSVTYPGCLWTENHTAQGFARRQSTVCFGTLLEFGDATVTYQVVRYAFNDKYERVIAVPFIVTSGKVIVNGPEEMNVLRVVELPKGHYRLVAGQHMIGDDEEAIDLFFEPLNESSSTSAILVADEQLKVPGTLIETAEIA